MKRLFLLSLFCVCFISAAAAADLNNRAALQGLTETRAVFDINQGEPKLLALRLRLVDETYKQLKAAGLAPKFVLTFRGNASFFLTKGDKYIAPEDQAGKQEIEKLLEHFGSLGLPLEQCAIAAGLLKIDTADFLPQVKVVANGYTSLIAYQNRGYALIPME